jgi:hypothetical protein
MEKYVSFEIFVIFSFKGGKTEGFFIESGAYEGETFSNSLLFELKRNYTGLFFIII